MEGLCGYIRVCCRRSAYVHVYARTMPKLNVCSTGVRLLGVLLPTISLLLNHSQSSAPSSLHTQSVAQLLSFATSSPTSFKEAAGKLDSATRELLEQSVRSAVGGTTSASGSSSGKPQISLRSF